jgi:hypothetical protein
VRLNASLAFGELVRDAVNRSTPDENLGVLVVIFNVILVHFTPTSSSWLNLVECLFRELTQQRIRGGSFRGVQELVAAIVESADDV